MKLMIIESPGKIKKLSEILGPGWRIGATVGHIRDLPDNEMGVEAPNFQPAYVLTKRGKEVAAKLKAMVSEADDIYLATDPDREGESISWHVQQCLKIREYKRVTWNEITASAVSAGLKAARQIDIQRVASQEARRVLDRLVGYMVSPALSNQTGESLSAGRVQSPAVRLVVDRERQIRAFKVTNHFGAAITFDGIGQEPPWTAQWVMAGFVSDEAPYYMDKQYAMAVAQVKAVTVTSFVQHEAKRSPPPPFITVTMMQAASVVLGLNPKTAMEVAQKLYEQGHITYHRTDNPNLSEESIVEVAALAKKLGLPMAAQPRKFKAPAGAQIGHPAITPTHWDIEVAGETDEQRALYKLIRLRAIACQLADARYTVRTARLAATQPVQGKAVQFEAVGRTLVSPGWLKLIAGDQTKDDLQDGQPPENAVPELKDGQHLVVASGKLLEKKTKPPSRYTEASLSGKLESEGIGRPATYASIMHNIVSRSYVKSVKKFLVPTDTGELIVDALTGKFGFIELGFSRELEGDLDLIAQGQASYKTTIARVHEQLTQELSTLHLTARPPKHACASCGKALRKMKGKNGSFWACTGYPDCKTTLPDDGGKPGAREGVPNPPGAPTAPAKDCSACGKPMRLRNGAKGPFYGCSGYPECKNTAQLD